VQPLQVWSHSLDIIIGLRILQPFAGLDPSIGKYPEAQATHLREEPEHPEHDESHSK